MVTRWWLNTIGLPDVETATLEGLEAKDKEYDLLAEHFESYIDIEGLVNTTLGSGFR
jgi:adenosylcobyric acid synthase